MFLHNTIRSRAQLVRGQHRRRTSKKNEMVTYQDTTQVARNMWVSFIWIKPLGRIGRTVLKSLVIFLLNKLALCFCKCEFFCSVIYWKCQLNIDILGDTDLIMIYTKSVQKYRGNYLAILWIPWSSRSHNVSSSYNTFYFF